MKPRLPNTTANEARIFKMVNDVDTLKVTTERQLDGKFAEIEGVLTETKETLKVVEDVTVEVNKKTKELDSKFETLSNEVVEVINEIKSEGLKGDKGDDADEDAIEERLLAKIPKLETIVKELPTKEEIVKEVIKQIPENKPSLKVIQESIDIEEVANKVEEKLNEKPFEIDRVNGLKGKLDNITRDVARKTGYHGGGDTVKAGTNISIATDGTGAKVISATGSGTGSVTDVSVVSANGLAGTVATSTTTPAITFSTTVTGMVKGNGTALSAAVANTDYQSPITLTTTGTSGAATFNGTTLNIPQYTGGGGGTGTVTDVSVVTANGISGTVATSTTTPAITLNISGLDATKIADGSISNTEFQYLNGVSSNIQTQLNAKEAALTFSTGLTRSTNTITSDLSTGISGGQSVIGGTGASENLTLSSTSNATKGKMLFGTSTYDEVNNRLGIGTASPSYTLDVRGTATETTGSQILSNIAYITPTAESSASYTAGYYDVSVRPGTGNTIAGGRGAYYQADNDGAGTVTTITGISSYGRNASTGTVINCYGNYALMQNISTGTVTAGYATAGAVQNTNTGTITTGTALSLSLSNSSTGTINTAYGINLATTNTSGTIANWYGIRITGVSGNAPTTNRYPIYISDAGNNYFAGSLGLGQTTPTAVLHLKAGTATASTAPLKFTAGTVNTTPEAGTMEFTNAEDGLTFTAVSTRRQVVLDTATQTLTNKTIQAPLIDYVIEPASDDTYEGEATNDINAGDTIAQWDLTYLDSTSGRWEFADADAVATSGGVLLALAAAAGTDGNPMNVVFRGVVRNDGWTWSGAGKPLYVSTTAGGMTETAPSGASDVIRVVGYTLSDDSIYFNPDNTWVVHS